MDDGTNIPARGWQYQDGQGGLKVDDNLNVKGKIHRFNKYIYIWYFKYLEIFSESLPEKVTLSSSGPAGDIHPRAMGVYSKLYGLTPLWKNSINNEFKLFYDGKKYEE